MKYFISWNIRIIMFPYLALDHSSLFGHFDFWIKSLVFYKSLHSFIITSKYQIIIFLIVTGYQSHPSSSWWQLCFSPCSGYASAKPNADVVAPGIVLVVLLIAGFSCFPSAIPISLPHQSQLDLSLWSHWNHRPPRHTALPCTKFPSWDHLGLHKILSHPYYIFWRSPNFSKFSTTYDHLTHFLK